MTGLSGWSWAALGAYVGDLPVTLGPLWTVLGRSHGLCWRSWAALGAYVGGRGPKNAKNMATMKMCLFLERERDLGPGGRSGGALGAYVGDLKPLLGLYWRSWAALGAAVCGPGPLLEPMLAVLGRSWAYVGDLRTLLGPMLAVWGRKMRRTWLP